MTEAPALPLARCRQAESVCGIIDRTYFSSPGFSAGVLRTDEGEHIRFAGKLCASEGEMVTLVGRWQSDPKYGRQFTVDQISYEMPETPGGLASYLARHPDFKGIGEKTAQRLVEYAGSRAALDNLLRGDLEVLHRDLSIPTATLETLRETWIANSDQNEVRSYLAGFGLTPHQTDTLLETFGHGIVGVLRNNPYELIRHVNGYGFKRVDNIARKMGFAKNHAGRIEAGITYCVSDEINSGHTWVRGSDLVTKANDVLLLDSMDSLDVIRQAAKRLVERGDIVATGFAVTTPVMLEAERLIHAVLREHAYGQSGAPIGPADTNGLTPRQVEAFRTALAHRITAISGGAGTGKTFVVAHLARTFRQGGRNVALCAPTGKAAKRIEELMRSRGVDLEAQTIHRLLGYDGHAYHRESLSTPVIELDHDGEETVAREAFDVVIVDEVSMVDVPLMAELLQRIDFERTQLILVGDHNQLPAVGPGNVLRDIIERELAPLVVLDEVVRQAGVLKVNSTAVLSGRVAPTTGDGSAWTVIDAFKQADHIQAYLRDLLLKRIPDRLGYDPVREVQIITPTHKGPLGTRAINEMMQALLHGHVGRKFALGDKVIQTANDYDLGVMNGTIGWVVGIEGDQHTVDFDGTGCRTIRNERLAKLQLAYALTAHKAQGSEFLCAVVLCHKSHFFADRNWLYTAVTRAARTCILVGDKWGLRRTARKISNANRRTFLSLWNERNQEDVGAS